MKIFQMQANADRPLMEGDPEVKNDSGELLRYDEREITSKPPMSWAANPNWYRKL
jgi:hypothetical protein